MDIQLITLSNYVKPEIKELVGRKWVENGRNNYFYDYIIERRNGSPTNASILNTYDKYLYGRGLTYDGKEENKAIEEILDYKEVKKIIIDFNTFGEAKFQIIKKRGGKLDSILHIPNQLVLPSVANDEDEILSYWYSKDWKKRWKYIPEEIPVFGSGADKEIYHIKPYNIGSEYFGMPFNLSSLQYCEAEEEISNLNINSIKNGLSAGYIINVPNGQTWDSDKKRKFKQDVERKLSGSSNANKAIYSINQGDTEIKIDPIPVNDNIHKQWQFLTQEARQQIMTGHSLPSPTLAAINTASGFSSTSDEMIVAESQLMIQLRSRQDYITDAFEDVLNAYGYNEKLSFMPLREDVEDEKEIDSVEDVKDNIEDDVEGNIEKTELSELSLEDTLELYALDPPEGFELHKTELVNLSSIANSVQDSEFFKIRYAYAIGTSKSPEGQSRGFCNKMMELSQRGKVFRVEDIEEMSETGVNGQFAHEGGKYNIFLYAGGVNCYHRWERRIFKKKRNEDGKPLGGNAMQNTNEINVNEARRQGAKIPKNPKDVSIAEITKPSKGAYPS